MTYQSLVALVCLVHAEIPATEKMKKDMRHIDSMFHHFERRVEGHIQEVKHEERATEQKMAQQERAAAAHEEAVVSAAQQAARAEARALHHKEEGQMAARARALHDMAQPSSFAEMPGQPNAPFSKFASWLEGGSSTGPSAPSLLETDATVATDDARSHWAEINKADEQVQEALASLHALQPASLLQTAGDRWRDMEHAQLKVRDAERALTEQVDDARETGEFGPLSEMHMRTD